MKIAILLMAILISGCTDPIDAKRVLLDAGYSDVKAAGYDIFACGEGDIYATKFTAKNPIGRPVSGTVCTGLFKGSTIRH